MRAVRLWSPAHPLESFASSLAQLLSRENRVQSFSYMCTDVSVSRLLGELQRLTSLQQLDVLSPFTGAGGQGLVVWARELVQLKPLRNLLSLQLHAREIRGSLPPALFRCLNRLQHLTISAKCRLPAAVVRQLSGLRSLELHGASMDSAAAQAASALQQLSRLCISVRACGPVPEPAGDGAAGGASGQRGSGEGSEAGKPAAAGAMQRWQEHPVWGQLPLLARLQVLAVGAELPAGGGECEAEPAVLPYDWLEGGVPDGIMDCSSLTHLVLPVALTQLPELVPGQLPRLGSLDLTHSIVEALPPSWCCHLQSLTRLVLNGAALAGGRLPPEFAALHSLRSLELRACRLAALPACVASLPGLTSLDLGVNRLADLPDGPYLLRLRHLSLRGNALHALPPALAGATQLEALDCGENQGLVLRPADVDSILAPLPRLRRLVLSRQPAGYGFGPYISAATGAAWDTSSVEALMHLARRLPQLAVELERTLPPCLPPAEQGGEEGAEPASAAL
ncbi:hypothetical protein COHA_006735 [Chlorella ohadii]|uniref:Uncharacterized protein n=1 Tax=Chlorella ohadii TaxID=2649997 RepID=A0AAD5H4X1_9CHLO|nr:hypothetical protein COHA_006735 [Chlorella ohadii]